MNAFKLANSIVFKEWILFNQFFLTEFTGRTGFFIQYPVDPVNPVYSKIKIESIHHFTLTKIFGYNS